LADTVVGNRCDEGTERAYIDLIGVLGVLGVIQERRYTSDTFRRLVELIEGDTEIMLVLRALSLALTHERTSEELLVAIRERSDDISSIDSKIEQVLATI
jgi:predicted lipid carrier protein YhbT